MDTDKMQKKNSHPVYSPFFAVVIKGSAQKSLYLPRAMEVLSPDA